MAARSGLEEFGAELDNAGEVKSAVATVEAALESEDLSDLKEAVVQLDEATRPLADDDGSRDGKGAASG